MNNRKIVIASHNQGKIKEFSNLLTTYNLIPQSEFGIQDIAETGLSFVENAILKARHAAKQSGLPAIADDSGLEVKSLQGKPGIYSARYAGKHAKSEDNIKKLLADLKDETHREAAFQCVLVFMLHEKDPTPIICQGTWQGKILLSPQGEYGFGYDPIFYVENKNCSAAELKPEVKNMISHRAQALQLLIKALADKI